jgi:hypothetical protein
MDRLLDTLRALIAFDTRNPGGDERALARHLSSGNTTRLSHPIRPPTHAPPIP